MAYEAPTLQTRAARYGTLRRNFGEYVNHCNREIALIGLIEDMESVSRIDENEDTRAWIEAGCRVIVYGTEGELLLHGATQAKQAFSAAARQGTTH